jgi:polyphenol oxidase
MWLHAPVIRSIHGFSDRYGGVSKPPFDSLNLGGSDDDPANIKRNKEIALQELGLDMKDLCILKQVHGKSVRTAAIGRQEGDALVSGEEGLVLAVGVADCYPLIFEDAKNRVVGVAHAGWRGTCQRIASATVKAMQQLGAVASEIRVAIGQGISPEKFEVGPEVTEQFNTAGFAHTFLQANRIDLPGCLISDLIEVGVKQENIWCMGRCTYEKDFFSHRRDRGMTGRMWGLISLRA